MRARRRGAVLLITLGVLAVLVVFALALASLLRLERRAATNVTDAARARFVAEAGIERATFGLTESGDFHSQDRARILWLEER